MKRFLSLRLPSLALAFAGACLLSGCVNIPVSLDDTATLSAKIGVPAADIKAVYACSFSEQLQGSTAYVPSIRGQLVLTRHSLFLCKSKGLLDAAANYEIPYADITGVRLDFPTLGSVLHVLHSRYDLTLIGESGAVTNSTAATKELRAAIEAARAAGTPKP